MRTSSLMLVAAGFGAGLFITFQADAMSSGPTGIRAGAEALAPVETIHCRPYRHQHGHPWGFGCRRGGGVSIEERSGSDVRVRGRTGSREDTTVRSRTSSGSSVKSETDTKTKSGSTSTKTDTSKTGSDTSKTSSDTSKSGTNTKSSGSTKSETSQKQQ